VIFDRKALLERVGGNEQFLTELLVLFLDEVPKLIKAIDNSIDINDEEVLYRSAHTLKGSAGNISALELYEVSLQLEQAAKVGDLLQARELLKTIKQLWAKFKNHVNLQVGELV
jgi:HPt (histidine-containing phosphotransfer) domain-containing protein